MTNQIQNALEIALAKAATEPAFRPDFYRLLLESQIFVLGQTPIHVEGHITVAAGEKLSIITWKKNDGSPVIPFFASLEALQRSIKEKQSFMALPARAFFEMTQGTTLVLNPASTHVKEFFPHEINALLTTGMNQVAQTHVAQKATQVLLGQPANYPAAMVSALSTLFANSPSIKTAYLCLMHDQSVQEKTSLLIGIESEEGFERSMQEACSVARDTAPKDQSVDFMHVVKGEPGLSAYFVGSVKPFYERKQDVKLNPLGSVSV